GAFKLADHDRLSLSNLNRLRAGVDDLGVGKTIVAARELLRIDPWLDLELYSDGVGPENIDEFLTGGGDDQGRVDLLVEECDDLRMKLMARERARAHRIPVIMDTSDRGLLDVERFDREPNRPVLHGLTGSYRSTDLNGSDPKDKLAVVLRIADENQISTR